MEGIPWIQTEPSEKRRSNRKSDRRTWHQTKPSNKVETVRNWTESSASSRYHRDILWIHSDGAHFVLRKLENHLETNYIFIRFTLQYSTMKFRQSSFSSSVLKHLLLKHLSIIRIFFSIKVIKVFRLKCILTYKRAFPRLINFTSQIISHGIFPSL